MFRFFSWLVLSCVILSACQSPEQALYSDVTDIVYGDGVLWIGNSYGATQIDPNTHTYTIFNQPGPVRLLLPIENGQVFAATGRGIDFFDGQVWSSVSISTTHASNIYAMGIDANGDLWLQANVGRSWFAFYVSGHIPPHEGPWIPKYLDSPIFPYDPTECSSWQALAIFSYTYRSLDECRRYAAAKSVLEQRKLRGYFVVESNGAIWLQSEDQLLRLAADGSTHPQGPLFEGSGLAPDPQGGIWVVSHDGLFHVTESTWQSIPLKPK